MRPGLYVGQEVQNIEDETRSTCQEVQCIEDEARSTGQEV
jgi:hypothetical protein